MDIKDAISFLENNGFQTLQIGTYKILGGMQLIQDENSDITAMTDGFEIRNERGIWLARLILGQTTPIIKCSLNLEEVVKAVVNVFILKRNCIENIFRALYDLQDFGLFVQIGDQQTIEVFITDIEPTFRLSPLNFLIAFVGNNYSPTITIGLKDSGWKLESLMGKSILMSNLDKVVEYVKAQKFQR